MVAPRMSGEHIATQVKKTKLDCAYCGGKGEVLEEQRDRPHGIRKEQSDNRLRPELSRQIRPTANRTKFSESGN